MAKVIFLHLSVIHSVHRGRGSASVHAGIPPRADTPRADNPPGADSPAPPEQTPPRAPEQTPPPGVDIPPGSRLQHTVYERPVRILLECILVFRKKLLKFLQGKSEKSHRFYRLNGILYSIFTDWSFAEVIIIL